MALGDVVQNIGFSIWATSATLPGSAVVGNSIVVFSNADDAGLTCSDDLNGSYTKIATAGTGPRVSIFLVTNTSAASAPVITLSASGRRSYAMEIEGELTPATGTGAAFLSPLSVGPTAFSTSTNEIPANSVSVGGWGATVNGSGITPDSPWTGVPGDNVTYPFFVRQDASAVTGGAFSGTYDGFDGTYDAAVAFASLVSASGPSGPTVTNIDTDNAVNQYQQAVVNVADFTEEIITAVFGGESCTVPENDPSDDQITIGVPGNLTTGTYDLVISGGTETDTLTGVSYTQTHARPAFDGLVDSNSILSGQSYTANTYFRFVSSFSNGTLDLAAGDAAEWAGDIADYYTPDEGFSGDDTASIQFLYSDGTTSATVGVTVTVAPAVDITPNQFDLGANVVDAEPGSTTQRTFVLAGIDPGETVSLSATGSATVSPSTGQAGDTITVELTAGTFEAVVSGGVSINGVSDSFSVTSRAAVLPTQDVALPDLSLGETDAVSIDLNNYFSGASSYTLTGLPAGSGLSFSGSVLGGNVNKDDITGSPYTLTATAFSADGSINDAFSVTVVDDIAPVISINPLTTLDTSPIVSGNAGDATSITLDVEGVDVTHSSTYSPTISSGSWSQQLNELALGTYTMTATGVDDAGNETVVSATLKVVEQITTSPRGLFRPLFRSLTGSVNQTLFR